MKAIAWTVLLLSAVALFGLGPSREALAYHDISVVVPVYFRATDQLDRQATYKPKIDNLTAQARSWYSTAHLSSGDSILVNAAIARTGSQNKSYYCNGANPCYIDHVLDRVIADLSNPSSAAYIGWDISLAKSIVTLVFFDSIGSGSLGLARVTGWQSHYNPEGRAGYAVFGSYVLDSSSTPGTPGNDGTVAHEIGHTLRLPHNTDNGLNFGSCALMGNNTPSCWPASTFLVDGQASDGRWYLEKQAVHYSSFTSPVGAPFPAQNMAVSTPGCFQRTLTWSPPESNVTQQVLIVAKRGTRVAGPGGQLIRVDKVFYAETTYVYYLSPTASSYTLSSLSPWTPYHWTVATVNASGHVHAWPSVSGFWVNTC